MWQDFLCDRRHIGAGHVVRQRAELGLRQRGVEPRQILIFGELLAHGIGASHDHHARLNHVLD